MAPAKRARPSFSPPRPAKSKSTSTTPKGNEPKWKNAKNAAIAKKRAPGRHNSSKGTGSAAKRGRPPRIVNEDSEEDEESEEDDNGRSALALVDMQADDDGDGKDGDDTDHQEDEEEDTIMSTRRRNTDQDSSPEPNLILAEITTTNEPSDAAIPENLVTRLLTHHFQQGEKTRISADARDLVGKYLEVFIREAIMRSAYEKDERHGGHDGAGGFLEVDDLEKAAVQLCLDF